MKYGICRNESQNSAFQPPDNVHVENISSGPKHGRPVVGTGYERLSRTLNIDQLQ